MRWRKSLGIGLLVLTAAGCGAAGRASRPLESAPDTAATRGADGLSAPVAGHDVAAAGTLAAADIVSLSAVRVAPAVHEQGIADRNARVEIVASSPVNYTSYQPDARHFILEIPNVDMSQLPTEIAVNAAGLDPVKIVSLPSHRGGSHARIEFSGVTDLTASVTAEGSVLAVNVSAAVADTPALIGDVEPADIAVMAQGDVLPEAPAALPSAPPVSPAETMAAVPASAMVTLASKPVRENASEVSGVIIEGTGDAASVFIIGDGTFRHRAFVLKNPDRLVIDLAGVSNNVAEKTFAVAADPLQRVRVAQFRTKPDKIVRVVFDLDRSVEHRLVEDSDGLRVYLGDAAAASAAAYHQPRGDAAPARAMSRSLSPVIAEARPAEVPSASTAPASMKTEEVLATATEKAWTEKPGARADTVAPATVQSLPDLAPRLVPSSPADLNRPVVLFDRAEPSQNAKDDIGSLIPMGTTFQSQTIAGEKRRYRGDKISITFRDADIREVFFFFADVMKMNVVLDPDVAGRIDIRLTQVPWDQAFQVILKNQGLDAVEEENVVRIAKTQKLRGEAAERRALKQAQEQEVDPITFTRRLSYAKVIEAMAVIQQVKSERGKIIADTRTNMLIISDIPEKKAAYENLLTALDLQTPQVSIEARIVEAIRSFERSLGIDWNFSGKATQDLGTQTNLQFPHSAQFDADVNLATGGAGQVSLQLGNVLDSVTLDVTLDAFEAEGKVRILSAPKVVTQNNQPATIEQGVQIPVVTTTATEIEVQYVPASLRLIVTPQITADETVIMKVLVENNQPSSTVSVGDTPGIVTERVDTQILVRSGTTTVIGGVYKLQETDNETGIPGLRRIPFFGWLFKNKSYEKNSSELIVFLTPKIVSNV